MLKNFLKVAFRNLLRRPGFSALNILGLTIGMTSALLILLWVYNEWTFDKYYPNASRIYTVYNKDKWTDDTVCWNATPKIMGPYLKPELPQVEKNSRVAWTPPILLTVGDKKLNIVGTSVDPDFLDMFSIPFVAGDHRTALNNPSSLVITEKLALKLFGNEDALGKAVKLDNKYNFTVTGIIKDFPNNSSFNYEFLSPWSFVNTRGDMDSSWGNNSTRNYIMVKQNASVDQLNQGIHNIIKRHDGPTQTEVQFVYPFSKMHLYGRFEHGKEDGGRISLVRSFFWIAIFILVIACINFMNLSTARSERRAKEVGIRKTVGALKGSLIAQFLAESMIIALIAGIISLVLAYVLLTPFNNLIQKQLTLGLNNPLFWAFFLGFIILTGLLAGSYPAFFLSKFQPVQVLKGAFKKVNALVTPRKILVVFQFSIAILLIICTLIVVKQLKYAQGRETGYDKGNLIYVALQGTLTEKHDLIRNQLLSEGAATSVTVTSSPISESWSNTWGFGWEGKPVGDKTIINSYSVDGHIVKTTGMKLIEGRDIDLTAYPSDSTACILNETAVKAMGFKHPIGQVVTNGDTKFMVVGVVKDFIMEDPFQPIRPIVIEGPKYQWFNIIHIKLNPANSTHDNIEKVKKIFTQFNPDYPFEYKFVDEEYAQKFSDETTTATLAGLFAGLTIFISCLGLFGLAAYMAENRIKEIGVRKVLGASILGITTMLSIDFLWLVLISILIAAPIAWYSMDKWLGNYKYRMHMSLWIFVLAGLAAIVISLATVSYQAIKAALANPIKSLRTE
jgi:putative ABC transport system permease protein